MLGVFAMVAGFVRFFTLPKGDRYLWPVTSQDWAAWGTWLGAVGTVAAVYYAAKSIRTSIEAQRGTEKELKADREHDRKQRAEDRAAELQIRADDRAEERRIRAEDRAHDLRQREEERRLVREDREALKKDADQIAKHTARQLSLEYAPSKPFDREYAVNYHVADESSFEGQIHGDDPQYGGQYFETDVAYVVITNKSRDDEFRQLSLCLNEPVPVAGTKLFSREAPPASAEPGQLGAGPPVWEPDPGYVIAFPEELHLWDLGQLGPGRQLMLEITFKVAQPDMDWRPPDWFSLGQDPDPKQLRWFVLEYEDGEGRAWVRSTRSRTNDPYRRTPDWEIEASGSRSQS